MTRNRVHEILLNSKEVARRQYKAELKGIFGSFARNEASADSDVDVLVEFQKGATLLDLAGLGDFLEEKLQRKVDVVTPAAIRQELKAQIYSDMVYL
ncbi:nucleotidyltransferase family protein [candidate division KSB1 bacterium]|nr:nucleotidyltransferase family protein [candidate division KSB1 bacterium]